MALSAWPGLRYPNALEVPGILDSTALVSVDDDDGGGTRDGTTPCRNSRPPTTILWPEGLGETLEGSGIFEGPQPTVSGAMLLGMMLCPILRSPSALGV